MQRFFFASQIRNSEHKIFGEYVINNKQELFEDSLGDFMAILKGDSTKGSFPNTDKDSNTSYEVIRMMKFMYF